VTVSPCIDVLTLRDYRAFPGPTPVEVPFGGGNLLVYGPNGAGKSSIFHALADFFSSRRRPALDDRRNVLSEVDPLECRVGVRFLGDAYEVAWHFESSGREQHPARAITEGGDRRVVEASRRRGCLDYRALLDTNFKHGNEGVNLFEIAHERLLVDFSPNISGGKTIGDLWDEMMAVALPRPHRQGERELQRVAAACTRFNQGFRVAREAMEKQLAALLPMLPTLRGITVESFVQGIVAWDRDSRSFIGRELMLRVRYYDKPLATPQNFLNEARLSALGLAIYLAAGLAAVPAGESGVLKLLVLDDVLIGLDHANRLPVLDLIEKFFPDWQVLLLTHDLVWFQQARAWARQQQHAWKALEMHVDERAIAGVPSPTLSLCDIDQVSDGLKRAKAALGSDLSKAGNEARKVVERLLRRFCEDRHLRVAYKRDANKVKVEELLGAAEVWAKEEKAEATLLAKPERLAKAERFVKALSEAKIWRSLALNPLSHDDPPDLDAIEVGRAVAAVDELSKAIAELR
jgi:energy-coupling factor transporter ATP-binding protein EcfA2